MKKNQEVMEPELLQQIIAENQQLETALTKRNEQYIFDLKKALTAANFTEDEKQLALHDMLPTMIKEQKNGVTARQLYGTVSERVDAIINKPAEKKEASAGLMVLDNFLLLFGMLLVMTSIMDQFVSSGKNSASFGFTAILIASACGALVFYLMYKLIYQYEYPGADRSRKPKVWKSMLIIGAAIVAWALIFSTTMYMPASINPVLDPIIVGVIGVAALALRYWLKKQFGITGSLAVPRQDPKQNTK